MIKRIKTKTKKMEINIFFTFLFWTWNIGRVEMMREKVDATTNMHDVTATI